MVNFLGLQNMENMTIVDLGCGTGAISIYAAGWLKTVYAVDVSGAMIENARKKHGGNLPNLKFINAGFAIERVKEKEAKKTLRVLRTL